MFVGGFSVYGWSNYTRSACQCDTCDQNFQNLAVSITGTKGKSDFRDAFEDFLSFFVFLCPKMIAFLQNSSAKHFFIFKEKANPLSELGVVAQIFTFFLIENAVLSGSLFF